MNKKDLRTAAKRKRAAISSLTRQEAAFAASQLWVRDPWFLKATHIACYLPLPEEFDSYPLIELIWQHQKQCYLPRLTPEKSLSFSPYQKSDRLQLNHLGILEPITAAFPIEQLEIVIMPMVAFDSQGYRLGMGGGYYDRTFECHQNKRDKCSLVGLGYSTQKIPSLPRDPWDIPCDGLLTEKAFIKFILK